MLLEKEQVEAKVVEKVDANSSLKRVVKHFRKATDIILEEDKELFEILSEDD